MLLSSVVVEGDRSDKNSTGVIIKNKKAVRKEVLQKASSFSQTSFMLENKTAEQIKGIFLTSEKMAGYFYDISTHL